MEQKHYTTILGIDPGTQVSGYGIIHNKEGRCSPLDFGAIRPPPRIKGNNRYLVLFDALERLIRQFNPDAVCVETQFMHKNAQSALKLGMARSTVWIAAGRHNIPVFEYTPRKVKLAIVGHGGASKEQVQFMVQKHLGLEACPQPHDAADALALALCLVHTRIDALL